MSEERAFVDSVLDELWEKALREDAIPWNDAQGDYPENGDITEKEREDLKETFPEELFRCYCGEVYDTPELANLCHAFHQM